MRINDTIQLCALPLAGAPVVRASEATPVFSVVEAQGASAVRVRAGVQGGAGLKSCATDEGRSQTSFGWRSPLLTAASTLTENPADVRLGAPVGLADGHGAANTVAKPAHQSFVSLGLVSLAWLGLNVRRPAAFGGSERLAEEAPLAALSSGRRGQMQDQFGTTGVEVDGYAVGSAAVSTSPIGSRDPRSSSPPG